MGLPFTMLGVNSMIRFLFIVFAVICMICSAVASTPNYDDDRDYENFVGRLYVDDVGIDVALYKSWEQAVVDRDDSAAYMGWPKHRVIGDHNTEAFKTLGQTKVGTIARIVKEDGTVVYYECVDIFKGHNTGGTITDWDGNDVIQQEDLLMYTCFNGPRNVWVTLWHETLSPEEKKKQEALNNYSAVMDDYIDELLSSMENAVPCNEYDADEEIELTMQ